MTARGFREVDHDLLADYVGGALEGTPEQDTVTRLVERDEAWATAYAGLTAALSEVHDDLTRWAGPEPAMPLAVTERIAAALAGAGPVDPADATEAGAADEHGAAGEPDGPGETGRRVVPAPRAGTRPIGPTDDRPGRRSRPAPDERGAARPPAGPGRRRRRWARLAGPVALAAAVVVAGGLGLNQLARPYATNDSGGVAADAPVHEAQPSGVAPLGVAAAPTTASGTDWTPASLAQGMSRVGGRTTKGPLLGPDAQEDKRLAGPVGLDRLTDPGALQSCLAEITTEHGAGTLTVMVVDYAAFQGQPALVVDFADSTGARWAWVSGPECGVPGSGADTRYRARVG
ncbi:hypothetical protein K7640_17255 [Micromonospora sp. PLK6-60]|uniref:hypothetical protein n=1 Tax=Micromonospora sp. PLK6-60 TaxID=2873383 RepID=UPI001CA78148|nr:hypothetical protein [Micromonospora sp. PLK6-60]MBY8873583.1 hypothetical protein [Micromonospora sp. PLK6-60]